MKKAIIKIDNFILAQLTIYIKNWIAKHEYKKHKVDFRINTQWAVIILCAVLTIIIPATIYLMKSHPLQALIHTLMWSMSIVINYLHILFIKKNEKLEHDLIFSLRKNPTVYNMEKHVLEKLFIMSRRRRVTFTAIMFGITILISGMMLILASIVNYFVAAFIVLGVIISTLQTYIIYVFDFDEPKPKEKNKKVASLTEIMQKAWDNLGLNPSPNYGT